MNHDEQSERCQKLAEELRESHADVMRWREQWMIEHRMRCDDADQPAGDLRNDITGDAAPCKPAFDRRGERHRGIEVRAGDRRKGEMSVTRTAPVAMLFASSTSAMFPPDSRSPVIPEPTTAATRSAVPMPSLTMARMRALYSHERI